MYRNCETVLGEKRFASCQSVFKLARRLRDSQTSINNKGLGLLVKKEAENICKDNIWSSFYVCFGSLFCYLSTNSLFYASCGFQVYQKMLNQEIYTTERSGSNKCFVLLWTCLSKNTNHLSLNNHFKGCVHYIFASFFFKSKEGHLGNKEKCFLFHFKSSFHSQENQIS